MEWPRLVSRGYSPNHLAVWIRQARTHVNPVCPPSQASSDYRANIIDYDYENPNVIDHANILKIPITITIRIELSRTL